MTYKVREFLRTFPTVFEYEDGDSGFFVDVQKSELQYRRLGRVAARLPFSKLCPDPEGAFDNWRKQFAGTAEWKPGRGRDD